MHPQSVLIVQLSSLAGVLHALPAARAIRAALPAARLGWVVESGQAGLVRRQPWIDETIEWDRPRWGGFREFRRRLSRTAWDIAIDFQGTFRSGLATRWSGAARRIGYLPSLELAHWFYNDCLPLESLDLHAVERNLDLAAKLGAGAADAPIDRPYLRQSPPVTNGQAPRLFGLQPGEDDLAAVAAWGRTRDFQPRRDQLVVLNPHASRPAHRWPVGHFIRLAERLLARGRVRVALSGGTAARETCDEIAAPFGDAVWRADGRFGPLGMAALFSQAGAVVSGDSGPLHLAAAVGAPLVALFGASSAMRNGPYASNATVLDRELACSPCMAKRCPLKYDPPLCMEQISVDRVLAAVLSRLAQWQQTDPRRKSA
ncbi:MAG TPA: glycosyltransferase family 9 protein [Pirellulales bacterium]|nr:glycosyltransferase family 9 protein [Pirellulales bacterium]